MYLGFVNAFLSLLYYNIDRKARPSKKKFSKGREQQAATQTPYFSMFLTIFPILSNEFVLLLQSISIP